MATIGFGWPRSTWVAPAWRPHRSLVLQATADFNQCHSSTRSDSLRENPAAGRKTRPRQATHGPAGSPRRSRDERISTVELLAAAIRRPEQGAAIPGTWCMGNAGDED